MNYQDLGQRIHDVRVSHNLSQNALAKRLICSAKHLGNIERGLSRPSLECLFDISTALNVSIDYLITGNTIFPPPHSEIILNIDHFLEKQQNEISLFRHHLKGIYTISEHQEK